MRRRALLGLAAGTGLGGCGFRPLYMPLSDSSTPVVAELAAVYVPVMSERAGQMMRQALQRRLEGSGLGVQKRYELITNPVISGEGIGIQQDSTVTRFRYNGTASWTLRKLDLAHTVLATGGSRITDGFNIVGGQFFAADIEGTTVTRRVVEALADQVVAQVAVFLRRQATPAPA